MIIFVATKLRDKLQQSVNALLPLRYLPHKDFELRVNGFLMTEISDNKHATMIGKLSLDRVTKL